MKVLFLYGWHSVPGGVKPTYLQDHGHEVISPSLDDDDFYAALATAQAEFDRHQREAVDGPENYTSSLSQVCQYGKRSTRSSGCTLAGACGVQVHAPAIH